jgi:hypothetical protein
MKFFSKGRLAFTALFVLLSCFEVHASTLYVDLNSVNPTPPYANWGTAANNIQDAVDASTNSDLVLVTNGVYATGGRSSRSSFVTNRVTVTNAVMVQSVNGPGTTVIQGYQVAGTVASTNAVRCVQLGKGAFLSGFTITNGEAGTGNDVNGGGVEGGASGSGGVISNCVVTGNICAGAGGGADGITAFNCVFVGNLAGGGGAASYTTLVNCFLTNNSAGWAGGTLSCKATNCLFANNAATNYGGASGFSTLVNCTVTGNSLQPGYGGNGGGSYKDTVVNCIVYNNSGPNGSNYYSSGMAYCCTAPLASGTGNVADAPLFVNPGAGDFHLQSNSPCINAGSNGYITATIDLDGKPRTVGGGVDMGAYEYQGNIRYVSLTSVNPVSPYSDWSVAATNIQDAIDAATNGDFVLVTNGVYQTGGRVVYGGMTNRVALTKAVTVLSVNGPAVTWIQGSHSVNTNAVRCAYLTNGATLAGFTLTNGATRNIGDSLHEWNGGGAWCESSSATLSNCVVAGNSAYNNAGGIWSGTVMNSLVVSNVAPTSGGGIYGSVVVGSALVGNTVGRGNGGAAYNGALTNCSIIGNVAGNGGGVANSTLYNCVVASNVVVTAGGGVYNSTSILCTVKYNFLQGGYGGVAGGGVYGGISSNCLVTHNSAIRGGGGYGGQWYSCTLASNIATNSGGGVDGGSGAWLYNCIAYYNSAPSGPDLIGAKSDYTCTTPPVLDNDFTNPPNFVNIGSDDYHLQAGSPCINSGTNVYAATAIDLDGNPRIVGGIADMGAYEFQTPGLTLPFLYAQQYGISNDGSVDSDHDGMNNWQEWLAGTNPTNSASLLKMLTPYRTPSGVWLYWQSVASRKYFLQCATDLGAQPAFSTIQSNILGQAGTTTFMDTNAIGLGPRLYRVGVQQ